MIKYNNSNINGWFFDDSNIVKVYHNGAVCYYKITSGDTPTPVQEPCFAVVDDITQYQDTEFEDVFNKADGKWYKLNNLTQYEEYGVYGSGRTECTQSRLPQGYTEVEYVENTSTSCIDSGFKPNQDTRIIFTAQTVTSQSSGKLIGAGSFNQTNAIQLVYEPSSTGSLNISWGTVAGWTTYSSCVGDYNVHTYDWNKNEFYRDDTLVGSVTYANFQCTYNMGIFRHIDAYSYANAAYFKGKMFALKIYDNGTLVRDMIPCQRDSDSKYGMYDIVNDTFYSSITNAQLTGGNSIGDCVTTYEGKLTIDDGYEYQYSGNSWVNVGEVSGSSKTSGFTILDIEGSGTTSSFGDGDYIVISYFNHNDPKTPSSMMSYKTQSGHNYQNDFSGHTGSNTITDNTIIDAAVWKLEVTSTANTYYIKNIDTNEYFGYQNTNVNNSFYLVDSANKAPILIDDYNGGIGLIEMKQAVSSYYGGYGLNQLYGYTYRCNWLNSGSGSKANFYANDGNALYVLYQVNDGGGLEYPVEYTVMQDPPNNLVFSSMTEAEEYECPWVGMKATIDGDNYVFSGDSQSGYEWVLAPVDYTKEYLTFEPISSAVTFRNSTKQFQYSLDKGATWATLTTANTVTVNVGQKLMVKGNFGAGSDNDNGNKFITSGGTWKAYGNVLSLLGSDNYTSTTAISNSQLINLFRDCTTLINVDNLKMPAYTAGSKAIRGMFRNCSGLVHVPSDLLSTFTAFTSNATAMGIFEGCTNLLESPIIPNMTVGSYGAYGMFFNCTSLTACTCLLTANNITGNKTKDLLNGVNTANGVFYKNPNTTWSSSAISNSKIPSGWSIQDYSG